MKKLPPVEWLREHLDYNPETGKVFLKKKWGPLPVKVGSEVGYSVTGGYRQIKIKSECFMAHRIAYALYHGIDPYPEDIDHINRNTADNTINNLRLVTHRQNCFNTSQRQSKTGITGIQYRRRKKPWQVMCNRTYIGSYETLDEAIKAREEAINAHQQITDKTTERKAQ